MELDPLSFSKVKQLVESLKQDRLPWWEHWRTIADYFLPRRYVWLQSAQEAQRIKSKNPNILDATGTTAARTLASGMMNGITSPARPWVRLRITGFNDELDHASRVWLDEVTKRMLLVMAESNFYNGMTLLYLDLVVFGTGAMMIYEDEDNVIHCYNPALGEYYLGQSAQLRVNTFCREFTYKVDQVVDLYGLENCSDQVQAAYKAGGARLKEAVKVQQLIVPNDKKDGVLSSRFAWREYVWEVASTQVDNKGKQRLLSIKGFYDFPVVAPRWEVLGNDSYGSSPCMDALPDVIQLQHETKKKAQGLDKLVSPPVVADIQLQHKPTALLPNGVTYVHGVNNVGVKPIYTVNPPLGEMSADIQDIRARIREILHNELFLMISQLDTVRSAAEIDARREEKLVLLGPVLERFENEALDPAIRRIFSIMERRGLLPEAPPQIRGANIEIQYISILTTAQSAVAAIPIERWVAMVGNISAAVPEVMDIPNWDELMLSYADAIGVPAKANNPRDVVAQRRQARAAAADGQAALAATNSAAQSAKLLSETEVGGGINALQRMLG